LAVGLAFEDELVGGGLKPVEGGLDRNILALSAYLGHVKLSGTYWYLSAVPELMAITFEGFERFAAPAQEPA
jgi:hypothetical protein